jgi:hypothetical protein
MSIRLLVSTSAFTALLALSLAANAAADEKEQEPKAPLAATRAASPVTDRHSHVQEKVGVPQKLPVAQAEKPKPEKDFSRHYHPRDGK